MKLSNLIHPKYCVTISTPNGDCVATFRSKRKMNAIIAEVANNTNADVVIFEHDKKGMYDCIDIIQKNPRVIGFR